MSKAKKKILFVITQGNWGGAQRYVFDLATNLNQEKFETQVAFGKAHRGELIARLETLGKPVYSLKYLNRSWNPFTNCLFIVELYRLIKKLSPDIVHFNSTNAGVFGPLAVKIYNLSKVKSQRSKVVYTAHGFAFNEPGWRRRAVFILAEKLGSFFRDLTICVSQFDHDSALRRGIEYSNKMAIVYNGIDANNFKTLPRAEARKLFPLVPENALLIGVISQFYKNKGLQYLIEAARPIVETRPNVFFAIMGGGPEQKNLELKIKNYGLTNKFFVLPYQENGRKYLSAFDIIAAPSVKEGLPYFLLEAALAKKAIVSTTAGGIPEIVRHGETGLIVEPHKPLALAEASEKFLSSAALRKTLGENAYNFVSQNFLLAKMIDATAKLYREI